MKYGKFISNLLISKMCVCVLVMADSLQPQRL